MIRSYHIWSIYFFTQRQFCMRQADSRKPCKKWWRSFPQIFSLLFAHPSPYPLSSHPVRVWISWDREAQLIRNVSRSLGNKGAQSTAGRGAKIITNHLRRAGSMLPLRWLIPLQHRKEETNSCWWRKEGSSHFFWTVTTWRAISR